MDIKQQMKETKRIKRKIHYYMKKLLLLLILSTGFSANAQLHSEAYQSPNSNHSLALKETNFLEKKLKLNLSQYTEVLQINENTVNLYERAFKDQILKENNLKVISQKSIQLKKLLIFEKEKRLKIILTPKQWEIYQSKKDLLLDRFWPENPY